jgi:hypothetical protein
MAEQGMYFVQGLAQGIADHTDHAVAAAANMARKVSSAGSVAVDLQTGVAGRPGDDGSEPGAGAPGFGGFPGFGGAPMAPVSSAGGSVTVINVPVTVQGSVIAERDLQKSVQTAVARFAGRNSGSGFTPAFS